MTVWRAVYWSQRYEQAYQLYALLSEEHYGDKEYKLNYSNGAWTVWERNIYADPGTGTGRIRQSRSVAL
ncbi:hypothetical protein M1L60_41415 [Actinoplanes sp. TRM 88003]|uniref:Uncharacterized protein n=1 Tax=Paractinoplanes aksuensis TaxID=2939490 RepID=A0ABT1E475_9ACTN|nr:hypothetical protein [Actinoplanes aksuensis]MCO8277056.1 hypothetical protein [Actinoplanes aksuensis]